MGISTLSVGAAVTPTVIETWCGHFLNRSPRRQKPTAHITYDVGLNLIRQFLTFAAKNTVGDIQAFTSQWVPSPTWVRTENTEISSEFLHDAAEKLATQLGQQGLEYIGGKLWWQWRPSEEPLKAEWIEMRKHQELRKKNKTECRRSMLYIHGGAYYFGSVDEHRYQIQRHARKLQARVLAPRYRLAPQYPFPCGLLDCLAVYLYLLTVQPPETIILAGDSAGGGMALSLMIILRDQGIPLPAGCILLSPWVDLTHSFPSVSGSSKFDYIPPDGFHHRPSLIWPPPNSDDLRAFGDHRWTAGRPASAEHEEIAELTQRETQTRDFAFVPFKTKSQSRDLSVVIGGKVAEIKDQIQMYTTNELLSHPLVSPILQPTLGGLPPIAVIVGGGEMLRDEQIYLAHKAAAPWKYPPPSSKDRGPSQDPQHVEFAGFPAPTEEYIASQIQKYPATYVQLQVWDDLCHVAATLSFTRPAKFMYRSVAQFGAWALARAQRSEIRILDDDEISVISDDEESSSDSEDKSTDEDGKLKRSNSNSTEPDYKSPIRADTAASNAPQPAPSATRPNLKRRTTPKSIGRAGDPLPIFKDHMIRQRVDRHGAIFPLPPAGELRACTMEVNDIGNIKPKTVKKWLDSEHYWAQKFGPLKQDAQKRRIRELEEAYGKGFVFSPAGVGDEEREKPPPTAIASRTSEQVQYLLGVFEKRKTSRGLAMWSGWGSHHDEEAIENEENKIKKKQDVNVSITNVRVKRTASSINMLDNFRPNNTAASGEQSKAGLATGAIVGTAAAGAAVEAIASKQSISAEAAINPQGSVLAEGGMLGKSQKQVEPQNRNASPFASTQPNLPKSAAQGTQSGGPMSNASGPTLAPSTSRAQYADASTVPFKLKFPNSGLENPSTITLHSAAGILPDHGGSETVSIADSGRPLPDSMALPSSDPRGSMVGPESTKDAGADENSDFATTGDRRTVPVSPGPNAFATPPSSPFPRPMDQAHKAATQQSTARTSYTEDSGDAIPAEEPAIQGSPEHRQAQVVQMYTAQKARDEYVRRSGVMNNGTAVETGAKAPPLPQSNVTTQDGAHSGVQLVTNRRPSTDALEAFRNRDSQGHGLTTPADAPPIPPPVRNSSLGAVDTSVGADYGSASPPSSPRSPGKHDRKTSADERREKGKAIYASLPASESSDYQGLTANKTGEPSTPTAVARPQQVEQLVKDGSGVKREMSVSERNSRTWAQGVLNAVDWARGRQSQDGSQRDERWMPG